MDRDEVALVLAVIASALLVLIAGALLPARPIHDEARAWRRIWMPAIPASFSLSILIGWAIVDPEGVHGLGMSRWVALVPCSLLWTRAAYRAWCTAGARGTGPALVKGLLVPRIELSNELLQLLTNGELHAVLAHEQAHVRHRDPLRILASQLMTDLQWPISKADKRRRTWLQALELARDDEAVTHYGANASDLASALVKVARMSSGHVEGAASLVDDDGLLEARVMRLLDAQQSAAEPSRSYWKAVTGLLIVLAFAFGALDGGRLIGWLAGVP